MFCCFRLGNSPDGSMRARNRSFDPKRLADPAKNFFTLVHFLRDLQNSLNVCLETDGSSREPVHARAGSSGVPLTSGCNFWATRMIRIARASKPGRFTTKAKPLKANSSHQIGRCIVAFRRL